MYILQVHSTRGAVYLIWGKYPRPYSTQDAVYISSSERVNNSGVQYSRSCVQDKRSDGINTYGGKVLRVVCTKWGDGVNIPEAQYSGY